MSLEFNTFSHENSKPASQITEKVASGRSKFDPATPFRTSASTPSDESVPDVDSIDGSRHIVSALRVNRYGRNTAGESLRANHCGRITAGEHFLSSNLENCA
ncbi:hypothetical protein A6X21_01150 [Planctopirus hydrillae]|uniref:Uncharacterized protein n=1 Tax=Planctopirus hydrillae TaxID=1841610 RepID=A0A1C3E505_9PLAN|nr:hypothetical protein A6X21_01150 [Planctopirus hydrillae]